MEQAQIDQMNAEFWNELCGTGFAKHLGITDHSPESLKRFDDGYFQLYPYFLPIINPGRTAGKDVLEVGLGYGSLGQKLAEAGARYNGLDIAPNAVRMTNLRLQLQGFSGRAIEGSALAMPFRDESFDFVFSIGCMHHTGNVQRCFDETFRVLRPGGTAVLMVYNKFSWRQWSHWPLVTTRELLREWGLWRRKAQSTEAQRHAFDHNGAGAAAPETTFHSRRELRSLLQRFENVSLQKQNSDSLCLPGGKWGRGLVKLLLWPLRLVGMRFDSGVLIDRSWLLGNVGRWMGLDIYIEARKPNQVRPEVHLAA
jgi:SAM-dependent methyltransferase